MQNCEDDEVSISLPMEESISIDNHKLEVSLSNKQGYAEIVGTHKLMGRISFQDFRI